ncbi:MAG: HNH endonuclease [Gammaproteobacteria bacterium]
MTRHFSIVFERDNHRCVYCGRDMMIDFETFWIAEEDHLVPLSKGGKDEPDNIVTACAVCNRLKGPFTPKFKFELETRDAYIQEIRNHIMASRAKHMQDFASWTHSKRPTRYPGEQT